MGGEAQEPRAIVGPLTRRQKYNVTIGPNGENVAVILARGTSGMGGGVLSARKVKKEFQEVVSGLQETILS